MGKKRNGKLKYFLINLLTWILVTKVKDKFSWYCRFLPYSRKGWLLCHRFYAPYSIVLVVTRVSFLVLWRPCVSFVMTKWCLVVSVLLSLSICNSDRDKSTSLLDRYIQFFFIRLRKNKGKVDLMKTSVSNISKIYDRMKPSNFCRLHSELSPKS